MRSCWCNVLYCVNLILDVGVGSISISETRLVIQLCLTQRSTSVRDTDLAPEFGQWCRGMLNYCMHTVGFLGMGVEIIL